MGKGIASIFGREWKFVGDADPAGYGAKWYRDVSVPSARPVNALGSTAQEYARGDIKSAMMRGVRAGDPSATLVAKIYGIEVKP